MHVVIIGITAHAITFTMSRAPERDNVEYLDTIILYPPVTGSISNDGTSLQQSQPMEPIKITVYLIWFEIYLFRVTRSSVINSCFSTRPWLNNTTTIHAWTTCGNSQCSYMTLQINSESRQWPGVFNNIWKRIPDHCTSIYKGAAHVMCSTQWYIHIWWHI